MSQKANTVPVARPALPSVVLPDINAIIAAIYSAHAGAAAPGYAVEGLEWLDTTLATRILKKFDGADWLSLFLLNNALNFAVPHMQHGPFVDVASAATVDLNAQSTRAVRITGTIAVTSFGVAPPGVSFLVRAAAALPLTQSSSLILLSGVSETMEAGDTKEFISEGGGNWREVNRSRAPLRLLGIDKIDTTNPSWAPPSVATKAALFIATGGGGGGHYASATAGEADAGAGGSAGATGAKFVPSLQGVYSLTIGPAGAAGVASTSANPSAGGDTVVAGFGINMICQGGTIGGRTGSGTTAQIAIGALASAEPTGADFTMPGEAGHLAYRLSNASAVSGRGGKSVFGTPGREVIQSTAGEVGFGYGAGGSGAAVVNGLRNGAPGRQGIVFVARLGW